ncbi:MAG: DUF2283 domain-containing protein [Candidatus Aenigmarchaeota archaeon]|nr:DUF2283 domain-containing protein [Candidatus Aenigmarchaeota archaeon]
MKVLYDPETDTLNFILRDAEIEESDEVKEGVIVDYDKHGKIVSIEVLKASKHTKKPLEVSYEVLKA